MARLFPLAALCACCAVLPLTAPACSSSGDDSAASADAAAPPEDGSPAESDEGVLAVPEASGSLFDAFVGGSCHTSSFCVTGEVCGFPSDGTGGCLAIGTCVFAAPPTNDAGTVLVACGCNGQNVPYVTPGLTSLPVISPTACVDAGHGDAGDASADAALDGSDASDAADTGSDASDAGDAAQD